MTATGTPTGSGVPGDTSQVNEDYALLRRTIRVVAQPRHPRPCVRECRAAVRPPRQRRAGRARAVVRLPGRELLPGHRHHARAATRSDRTRSPRSRTGPRPGQGRPASVPGFIARIVVEHADGTSQTVVTDATWRAHEGPWLPGTLPQRRGRLRRDRRRPATPAALGRCRLRRRHRGPPRSCSARIRRRRSPTCTRRGPTSSSDPSVPCASVGSPATPSWSIWARSMAATPVIRFHHGRAGRGGEGGRGLPPRRRRPRVDHERRPGHGHARRVHRA